MRLKLFVVPMICFAIAACQSKTNDNKSKEEPTQDVTETKIETKTVEVLNDTIGIHQITNSKAREWIVDMSKVIRDIERAMNNNNPSSMPSLMKLASENQRSQLTIQSNLSKSDRTLFNSYADKLSTKLIELGDRMSKMQ
jgi:thiamine biosynthesis lipoprotein ApbE